MSVNLIANRYAKALFSLSSTDSKKAETYAEFLKTAASLFDIPESKKILKSPVMPSEVKKDLLNYARTKSQVGPEIEHFCDQLVSAGRVNLIPEISDSYSQMLDTQNGVAHAVVTTAEKLNDQESTELQKSLNSVFNKKLTIENKVNQKILGGVIVNVGNFAIDLSVKAKLEALSECAQQ
jgi:F-type H+-transporting ATPase subunit delta